MKEDADLVVERFQAVSNADRPTSAHSVQVNFLPLKMAFVNVEKEDRISTLIS